MATTEAQQLVAQQAAQFNALLDKQKAEQQGLFGQYTTTLNKQEKLPVLYQRLNSELGIPELNKQASVFKDQIYNTKDLLDRLDEDITTRTAGTFTNDAQRRRIVASEAQPLETTLSRLGNGLAPISDMITSAQNQLSTLLPLNVQQQSKELQPIEMQINAAGDRFAREITGFTSSKQSELSALMDKLQRDRELADREWQRAQQLAAEERDYAKYLRENAPAAAAPKAVRRNDGGYNFTDASGKPISAGTYATLTKTPIGTLLNSMASTGDKTAANAYRWLQSIQGSDLFKSGAYKKTPAYNSYSSLFWGAQ